MTPMLGAQVTRHKGETNRSNKAAAAFEHQF
jgi:hypothetical protein